MLLIAALLSSLGGCARVQDFLKTDVTRFLSPEKVISQPKRGKPINLIYSSVGPADSSQELVPNATFPREGDWAYSDADYVLGPSDVVNVSILDLFYEGLETTLQRTISESGYIDLPLLDERIGAEGLTKEQLRDVIAAAYSPDVLIDPVVSVTIAARRRSTFSVLGAVARPNTYMIYRNDMRLTEALAMAGGITQRNINYIYVIRREPAVRISAAQPARSVPSAAPEQLPELPPEAPPEGAPAPAQGPPPAEGRPVQEPQRPPSEIDVDKALRELGAALPGTVPTIEPTREVPSERPAGGKPKAEDRPGMLPAPSLLPRLTETAAVGPSGPAAPDAEEVETLTTAKAKRFIYTSEGWVPVYQEAPVATRPSGTGAPPVRPAGRLAEPDAAIAQRRDEDPFGWRKLDKSNLARIIAINLNELRAGNQRMDIIIRRDDLIQVPTLQVGEFYVIGEVLRPGVYDMTGRRVNVKQAIAAAGNFAPLAFPENAVLYRRVGKDQEQTIPLDLEAIFKGEQPDIFLKPNDVLAVGTDVRATFYAVMRNAFRLTYGFGFIYDRNFANPFYGGMNSMRFKRW